MRPGLPTLAALGALAAGCASPPPPAPLVIDAPERYEAAFAAAKEALVQAGFELDRIDARAGVITTRPNRTAGLATPWDDEQSTLAQEWEDFTNLHQRTVRVTFEPADPAGAAPDPALPLDPAAPLRFRVSVVVERVRVPGWRVEPDAVGLSTYTFDPALADRGMWPRHAVALERDTLLEDRLAAQITRRAAPGGG